MIQTPQEILDHLDDSHKVALVYVLHVACMDSTLPLLLPEPTLWHWTQSTFAAVFRACNIFPCMQVVRGFRCLGHPLQARLQAAPCRAASQTQASPAS